MPRMYELTATWAALVDAYDMAEDADERAEALAALEDVEADMADKADAIARIVRNYKGEVEALKAEEQRLTLKRRAKENAIDRLNGIMLEAMQTTGADKVETSIGKWALQQNPMSCDVTDPDKVPERFHVPQPDKIDKAAMIREHKATGELFDGAEFKQETGIRFR